MNGSPVTSVGMIEFGSLTARSSSARLFLLTSPSTTTIGIAKPDVHTSSGDSIAIVASLYFTSIAFSVPS